MKATIEITSDGVHYGASINQSIPSVVGTVHAGIQWDQVAELLRLSAEPEDVASTQETNLSPVPQTPPRTRAQIVADREHWMQHWCSERGLSMAIQKNRDDAAMAWIEHVG